MFFFLKTIPMTHHRTHLVQLKESLIYIKKVILMEAIVDFMYFFITFVDLLFFFHKTFLNYINSKTVTF